jgi:hypothetical protein
MDVDETRDFRLIHSADRQITDSRSCVRLCATQYSDGSLDDLRIEVFEDDNDLNSDQARELAVVLLEAADELDRWAAMSDDRLSTSRPKCSRPRLSGPPMSC